MNDRLVLEERASLSKFDLGTQNLNVMQTVNPVSTSISGATDKMSLNISSLDSKNRHITCRISLFKTCSILFIYLKP